MADFSNGVMAPNFLAAVPVPVDTRWIAGLLTDYAQGQQQQRQLAIMNAGRDTTPPGASAPDFAALTNRLMQLGAYDQAGALMSLGIRQRVLNSPGSLDDPLGRGAATGAQPTAAPASGFGPAVNRTLAFEGGMNPRDTNGTPSNFGINAAANPDIDVKNLTPDQARSIYKTRYWDTIGADSLPPALQGIAFDTAVIAGPGRAKEMLAQSGGDPAKFMDLRETFQDNLLRSDPQKYGAYADVWGKRNAALRASVGIGGQPSTATAYAPQPAAAPAQAAIGAATASPYRVASLGPVAPPQGAPAPVPQQPGFGAVNGAPTAGTAQSQMVTPTEWAAKFNPADPALAGKIADAIGIDPGEAIDVQDRNIRAAVVPVLTASRRATAAPTQQNTAPMQSGAPSTTVDQPASNTHPFGPGRIDAESGNTVAPFYAPAPVTGSVPPVSAQPVSAPIAPIAARPAPAGGPDIPGLPAGYQQPGGGQQYVNDILNKASQFEDAGLAGKAKVYMARAQQVQAQLENAQKAQLDLQTHNAELTPEQKNFGTMRDQYGFTGSPLDLENQQAQQKADARARATAQYGLVETQQPDGTTIYVPRAQVLNGTAGGGSNGPVVKSQPAYVTQGQSALLSKLNDGATAFQERQVAGERLDALGNLLSTFQTGANSDAFNNAAANLRSFGIDVPDTATTNPAAMQTFAKNAYASVLSAMREQGNKQFVAEVQSAINSNPNPNLQPAANQAMIAQIKGIQSYRDQNYRDYSDWYDGNKGASNDAKFQTDWAKANPLSRYVGDAKKEIAPLGVAIPPADQRVVGQRYAVPGQGVFRWQGNGWSKD